MENKTQAINAKQTNHSAISDAQLKWVRPQLSPLDVADGTNGKVLPFANETKTSTGTIGPGLS
jgi:hypothetical protein